MQVKRRIAMVTAALIGMAGLGTGVAVAQPRATGAPPAVTASHPNATGPPHVTVAEVVEELRQSTPLPAFPADRPGRSVDQKSG
jgi:hypothetical protein